MKDNKRNISKRYSIKKLNLEDNSSLNNIKLSSEKEGKNMIKDINNNNKILQGEVKNINILETQVLEKSKEEENNNNAMLLT